MNHLEETHGWLHRGPVCLYFFSTVFDYLYFCIYWRFCFFFNKQGFVSLKHEDDKTIAFERAELLFLFNFHPQKSFPDYRVGVEIPGSYKILLNSDDPNFGGFNRIDASVIHHTFPEEFNGRKNSVLVGIVTCFCLKSNSLTFNHIYLKFKLKLFTIILWYMLYIDILLVFANRKLKFLKFFQVYLPSRTCLILGKYWENLAQNTVPTSLRMTKIFFLYHFFYISLLNLCKCFFWLWCVVYLSLLSSPKYIIYVFVNFYILFIYVFWFFFFFSQGWFLFLLFLWSSIHTT